MSGMFRLTGKPVADILLIFLWWPIAASIFIMVGLIQLISEANRLVDEADRRRAEASVPLETFGPVKVASEPILVSLKRHGPLVASTLGVLLVVAGGVARQFGIAFLGCLLVIAAAATWTWWRARGSRVWKAVGFGFLAWVITVPIAATVAPPEIGPKASGLATSMPGAVQTPDALRTTAPARQTAVPDLVGLDLPKARDSVHAVGLRSEPADLSPLCRKTLVAKNWTVIGTNPPAGISVSPDQTISLLVLKKEEAAWFAGHPKMPQLPKGTPARDLTDDDGPLAGLQELVLLRYAKSMAPQHALTAVERPCSKYSNEPPEEVAARAGLKQAYSISVVVGSIPAAGQPVRPGRLIVVLVRDKEQRQEPTGSDGGSLPVPPRPNDDNDDVNIPGWLCPTRFC
ncbi:MULTISPECIES: PASTA domain-containing protein [unclassified Micromonospora]|uniref:PASTA domain-containing protein n=1 Tax=unclassified Micromonospora TaxID=2617518 RepID=UPI002FF1CBF6